MKSFAIISTFLATALAAPASNPSARQVPGRVSEIVYRVSNLEDPNAPKWAETTLTVNDGAKNWDTISALVGGGGCESCLNTGGMVFATRVDILTPLEAIHCNLYNSEKHVIAELNSLFTGADFDGVENLEHNGITNKAINADKYSLLCYYV